MNINKARGQWMLPVVGSQGSVCSSLSLNTIEIATENPRSMERYIPKFWWGYVGLISQRLLASSSRPATACSFVELTITCILLSLDGYYTLAM